MLHYLKVGNYVAVFPCLDVEEQRNPHVHVWRITKLPSGCSNKPVGMVHETAWGTKKYSIIASQSWFMRPSYSCFQFENAYLNKVLITLDVDGFTIKLLALY
jgi:hypothetical protein